MQRIPKLRAGLAALAGIMATAALAAPAHAGVLTTTAADCGDPLITQPFTPWNDTNHYKLADAGDFEAGTPGWTLTGGAKVVAGDATSLIGGASDDSSLSLPAGSSATTPSVCVGMDEPTMRFLARGRTGVLAVSVIAKLQLGLSVTLPIGTVLDGDWRPSAEIPVLANLTTILNRDQTPVRFKFTPVGGKDWQIDDVYVDPRMRS